MSVIIRSYSLVWGFGTPNISFFSDLAFPGGRIDQNILPSMKHIILTRGAHDTFCVCSWVSGSNFMYSVSGNDAMYM